MTASRPKVLIAEPQDFSPNALERLRAVAEVELRACAADEVPRALRECDVFWMRLAHRIDARSLPPRGRLRAIATPVTGTDHIDAAACQERGVEVLSLRGEVEFLNSVRATAELTVGLALALMRKLVPAAASVREGEWARDRFRGNELYGKTAGIVGVGRLGTLVAGYLQAFGMRVIGYDVRPDFPNSVERASTLVELLQRSDLVSLHVSYQASTRHLLGAQELAAMKAGAVLINTARGGVVDERALLEALGSGSLGGAALDVVDGEPEVRPDHPVLAYARQRSNLLVVPHIGGNTVESFEKTEVFLAEKVARFLGGDGR